MTGNCHLWRSTALTVSPLETRLWGHWLHGKGLRSAGREPVLKGRIRKLLTRRDEVLAFVEPRALQGGGGAVVVLLEA